VNHSCQQAPRSNPFSAHFVRPGAIPFLFDKGQNAEALVERLAEAGWRGQIIGPHGSGKSTLLATLDEPLARGGRRAWSVALHDGGRRMPADWACQAKSLSANLIVVDGYEQLSTVSRIRLKARCRRLGWGLLVTAHRDVGLTTLFSTAPTLETTQVVVRRLLGDAACMPPRIVAECYAACAGNVRETLFALYDRWESARR
jgi:hypothetical protein